MQEGGKECVGFHAWSSIWSCVRGPSVVSVLSQHGQLLGGHCGRGGRSCRARHHVTDECTVHTGPCCCKTRGTYFVVAQGKVPTKGRYVEVHVGGTEHNKIRCGRPSKCYAFASDMSGSRGTGRRFSIHEARFCTT